jgi:hypothetical protein
MAEELTTATDAPTDAPTDGPTEDDDKPDEELLYDAEGGLMKPGTSAEARPHWPGAPRRPLHLLWSLQTRATLMAPPLRRRRRPRGRGRGGVRPQGRNSHLRGLPGRAACPRRRGRRRTGAGAVKGSLLLPPLMTTGAGARDVPPPLPAAPPPHLPGIATGRSFTTTRPW